MAKQISNAQMIVPWDSSTAVNDFPFRVTIATPTEAFSRKSPSLVRCFRVSGRIVMVASSDDSVALECHVEKWFVGRIVTVWAKEFRTGMGRRPAPDTLVRA